MALSAATFSTPLTSNFVVIGTEAYQLAEQRRVVGAGFTETISFEAASLKFPCEKIFISGLWLKPFTFTARSKRPL